MKEIIWSPRAIHDFLSIIGYLEKEWGSRVAQAFIDLVYQRLETIIKNPELYPLTTKRKNIRRCVLRKQVSLYYRIYNDEIQLITLFDNRRNPKERKI